MALSQSFHTGVVPLASAQLSFEWFAQYTGSDTRFLNAALGFDYQSDEQVLTFRVDILRAGAAV